MRVAGYIRVSTTEQAMNGMSLQAQTDLITEWAKQNHHELVKIYADEGKSASKQLDKRKALLQMVQDAESKQFDLIAFKDMTRWSRNAAQFYKIQERLDKCKVAWVAIQQPYLETITPTGRFQTSIMLGTAQLEAEQTGERIRFVQQSQVHRGNYPFPDHDCAMGYKIQHTPNGTKLVIDNEKVDIVRFMFDTFCRTANMEQTARIMTERYGWNYRATTIRRSLANRIYIGEFRDKKNFCEPIISKQQFEQVQSLMKHRNMQAGKHVGMYVFSGMLRCAKCGGRMRGQCFEYATKDVYKYQCKTYGCSNYPFQDKLEQNLLNQIEDMVSDYRLQIDRPKENRIAEYRSELERLDGNMDRLTDIFVSGHLAKEDYVLRKDRIESRMNELHGLIDSESETVPPMLEIGWMDAYKSLSPAARNRFWKLCCDCIYVDGNEPKNIVFLHITDDVSAVLAEKFAIVRKEEKIPLNLMEK